MKTFFSVLIPAYKKKYLFEAIDSVLSQTYRDFELVIINDCSPEDLTSVVRRFNDERIHYYINEKNYGAEHVVENWNKCLNICSGDWVICMGDDDMLMPNCLEVYVDMINNNNNVDLLHGRVRQIDNNGKLISILEERPQLESSYSHIIGRMTMRKQYIGDFCFRRSRLIREGGFYNLPFAWGADDISAFMCCTPNGVANTNIPVFSYRVSADTISSSKNTERKLQALNREEEWLYEFLRHQNPRTELEIEEHRMLSHSIKSGMDKARYYALENEMGNSFLRVMYCFQLCKRYKLSKRILFKLVIRSLIKIM